MYENFAYMSTDYKDIIEGVQKEAIINFLFKVDELLKQNPKTEEEFKEKYSIITDMTDEECEEYVEKVVVTDLVNPNLKLTDDNLYYITNEECDSIILKLSRKIYLKLCGKLVEKGVLEPAFDANINDFVFTIVKKEF